MDFLDDDPYPPESGARRARPVGPATPSGRAPLDPQRQILVRRLGAVGVAVLFVIVVVLLFKGCLDARKERGFENYVNDLGSVLSDSSAVSEGLFGSDGLFQAPGDLGGLDFETQVKADRSTMETLVDRVEGLDAPGELGAAQGELELAFKLRRDGLAGISNDIGIALGDKPEESDEAIQRLTGHMKAFIASDVLYSRVQAAIEEALAAEDVVIEGGVPESEFLPDPVEWLDQDEVASLLSGVSGAGTTGGGGPAGPGTHGLGLTAVTLLPDGLALQPGTAVTATAGDELELEIQAQNQGESEETDIPVVVEVDGESSETTIDEIAAGETVTVSIPLQPTPSPGDTFNITVTVTPVDGEEFSQNNEASYTVSFG